MAFIDALTVDSNLPTEHYDKITNMIIIAWSTVIDCIIAHVLCVQITNHPETIEKLLFSFSLLMFDNKAHPPTWAI